MDALERVELLSSKRDYLYLLTLCSVLFCISLAYEYYNYTKLTQFDTAIVNATVLKQYNKTKVTKNQKYKEYQVLKLRADKGFYFYTSAQKNLKNCINRELTLEITTQKISFYEYLRHFFAFSKIINIPTNKTLQEKLIQKIANQHSDKKTASLYKTLYLATPLDYSLQKHFSELGISHLLAISGFHIGLLSAILFFILGYPYSYLQNRYFPYRSKTYDITLLTLAILSIYMIFLNTPPSLLRALLMIFIAFILYERGMQIFSMQTLLVTLLFSIALAPRLLFSLGFFLSISGVFYIFLFLKYFQKNSKLWHYILLPIWIYLMMLPYSLVLFGNFSLYHPLSIIFTALFSIFYPLSIVLHIIGLGNLLDGGVQMLLEIDTMGIKVQISPLVLLVEIVLSLAAIRYRQLLYMLFVYAFAVFIYAIYHIA